MEVCELKQEAFKPHNIPGTIEAEDYDLGCPRDAYHDLEDINQGGKYRPDEGVDIDTCSAGGYALGWTVKGEWLVYTVTVSKSSSYKVSFYTATTSDNAKLHLECDDANITGSVLIPNTTGYQNWEITNKTIELEAGKHLLKIVIDAGPLNLDKIVFEEIK